MSSALLYAAIVVVWAVILVPMWLRRDGSRTRGRRTDLDETTEILDGQLADAPLDPAADAPLDVHAGDAAYEDEAAPAPARRAPARRSRARRAAVIARRRRRTTGLTLLVITAAVTVATGLTPWWFVLPPVALLAGHLALLRVAAKMDAERRRELRRRARRRAIEAERRARAAEQLHLAREAEVTAEVIEMPERSQEEVYDQYTDRAVGD